MRDVWAKQNSMVGFVVAKVGRLVAGAFGAPSWGGRDDGGIMGRQNGLRRCGW